MDKISVVINTLNEENNLPQLLCSIKDLAAEIIVVDMKSDDATCEIAKRFGAKVYEHKRTNYVEPARNYAISKALNDWILILDADEVVTSGLKNKIKEVIGNAHSADFYYLPRKNIFFNKWVKHSRWWPDMNIRFFKKGAVKWSDKIHSIPLTKGRGGEFEIKEELAIVHYGYRSISQYLGRLNRYTTVQAEEKIREGCVFSWNDLIKKPAGEFFSRFFMSEGYKDNLHGFVLAVLQAVSEFVVILKIWEAKSFKDTAISISEIKPELDQFESDLKYWEADALYKETKNPIERIRRKFRI